MRYRAITHFWDNKVCEVCQHFFSVKDKGLQPVTLFKDQKMQIITVHCDLRLLHNLKKTQTKKSSCSWCVCGYSELNIYFIHWHGFCYFSCVGRKILCYVQLWIWCRRGFRDLMWGLDKNIALIIYKFLQ